MQQNKFVTMARDNRQSQSVVDGVGWTERGSRQERENNEKYKYDVVYLNKKKNRNK